VFSGNLWYELALEFAGKLTKELAMRFVVKFSGEAMRGADGIYNDDFLEQVAGEIATALDEGHLPSIVVGGGNIWRGAQGKAADMDASDADYMGMLATVINSLRMKDSLIRHGVQPRVMSALGGMNRVCEDWVRNRALRHLEKGRVVVLAAGTGNPHQTTDYAGALRAIELKADLLLKGTHGDVDGVYTADPHKDENAKRYLHVPFKEVLDRDLEVMDLEAISLCRRHKIPIRVFNIMQPGSLKRALAGEAGTMVSCSPRVVMAD
jgi:uridylate kinase